MKTIAVSNGDIQLRGGKVQFVTGTNKLVQDLTRWLEEPLGTGFTSPGFGSTLWQNIGTTQNSGSATTIQNEVLRVLELYQGQQVLSLQNSQSKAQLANWNKNEIIQRVVSINTRQLLNGLIVYVTLETLTGTLFNLNINVDNINGVTVNNG